MQLTARLTQLPSSMVHFPLDANLLIRHEKTGDPLADAVAQLIIAEKPPQKDMLAFVEARAAQGEPACLNFLEVVSEIPGWVNFAGMEAGADLFLRNSLAAVAVFVLHSLVLTYVPVNMARVLIHTGRLRGQVLRRLFETATMVRDVLEPGALRPGEQGWRAVLRVRILHALVRQSILQGGRWQHEVQPINQLELAQTGTLFGFVVADGLERLGIPVSDAEKESYHHLWRYANWLQGVPDSLQVSSFADEARLHRELGERYYFPDDNSFALINSLFSALDMQAPFFMPQSVLRGFTAFLLDRSVAGRIQLNAPAVPRAMLHALSAALPLAGYRYRLMPLLRQFERDAGRQYFHDLIRRGLAGAEADYVNEGAA